MSKITLGEYNHERRREEAREGGRERGVVVEGGAGEAHIEIRTNENSCKSSAVVLAISRVAALV
jgi:hypothetical protein